MLKRRLAQGFAAVMILANIEGPTGQTTNEDVFAGSKPWSAFETHLRETRDVVGSPPLTKDWLANLERASPPPDAVRRFGRVSRDLEILVVSSPYCDDSAHTVPYIAALARLSHVPVRVAELPQGARIRKMFKTPDGRNATPTVAFVRSHKIIAAWVERPKPLAEWLVENKMLPGRELHERKLAWYESDRGQTTIREIVELAELGATSK